MEEGFTEERIDTPEAMGNEPPLGEGDTNTENPEEEKEAIGQSEDYERLMAEDLITLKAEFPELCDTSDITEIKNPLRYAALRDLGLTPTEAYLAARGNERRRDSRAHIRGTVPIAGQRKAGAIARHELEWARENFNGMSDSEIEALFRKVTK